MTTPPPPPSSSQWSTPSGQPPPAQPPPVPPPPAQPSSGQPPSGGVPQRPPGAPTSARPNGDGGRRKWWSAGRVFAAVVIVLVLMGGSATAGFFAGAAWSGAEAIGQGIVDDLSGDIDVGTGSGDGTDAQAGDGPAVDGDALQVGDTLTGTFDDAPVRHDLTVEEGSAVTIELRSDDFDTVVRVLDADGGELAENDDIELGQNRNSRVELELPAGSYTVVVDAFGFGEGRYELSVS